MPFSLRRDALALAILLAMSAATALAWPHAPAEVPTHWGIDGEPDAWGSPFVGLMLLPLVTAGTWALMLFLPRFDPGRANYVNFAGAYAVIRTLLVAFLAVMHGVAVANVLGAEVNMGAVVAPLTGALFIVLGGLMGKIRPNWFVGIRTPWTLSSKLAWTRTHRVGGWAFVLTGVAVLIAGLLSPVAGFVTMMVGVVASTLFALVYSQRVWASDPDRQDPGDTTPSV